MKKAGGQKSTERDAFSESELAKLEDKESRLYDVVCKGTADDDEWLITAAYVLRALLAGL